METPENDRHDAQCIAMADGMADQGSALIVAVRMRRKLIEHFEETDQKPLAEAIRYGLVEASPLHGEHFAPPLFAIDEPDEPPISDDADCADARYDADRAASKDEA